MKAIPNEIHYLYHPITLEVFDLRIDEMIVAGKYNIKTKKIIFSDEYLNGRNI
jgi:hypothetical protein